MKQDVNYSYTKDIFDRLEKVTIDGVSVPSFFVTDGYDYWQFYKQRIFEDIKEFSRARITQPEAPQPFRGDVKDFFVNLVLFIVSFIALLKIFITNTRVLVYSIDRVNSSFKSDFRLEPLYDFLYTYHIAHTELFHTIPSRQTLHNIKERRRVSLFLKTSDWLYQMGIFFRLYTTPQVPNPNSIDVSQFQKDEQDFVRWIIVRYVQQINFSHFKINFLSRIFRIVKPKALFLIDDARYYHEVLLAAKLAGVQSYALQHGHFTKYHVGWLRDDTQSGNTVAPDVLLVWNMYWKNELMRLRSAIPESSIIVGGEKVKKKLRHVSTTQDKRTDLVSVLIPYETSCPKTEVTEYINRMLNHPQIRVIFKLRPDIDSKVQLREYGLETCTSLQFSTCIHIEDCIDDIDIVAGVYSTFLYDMIAYGKPVVILETSSDYGEGMQIHGLADTLRMGEVTVKTLMRIRSISPICIEERKQKLLGARIYLEDTLRAIAEENNLLKKI